MKKLRCKKKYGTWYYEKILPTVYNDLDAPIYELYNKSLKFVYTFGSITSMLYYLETGEII